MGGSVVCEENAPPLTNMVFGGEQGKSQGGAGESGTHEMNTDIHSVGYWVQKVKGGKPENF